MTIHLGMVKPTGLQATKFQLKKMNNKIFTRIIKVQIDIIAEKLTVV